MRNMTGFSNTWGSYLRVPGLTAVCYCSGSAARSLGPLEAHRTSKTHLISTKNTNVTLDLLSSKQHHKERNHNQRSQVVMV